MNETEHNWKTHKVTQVYENPWIRVEHDEVTTPSGTAGIYGRIVFKNKAIGIIPLDKDMNTWLVGQYRYPLKEYSWEIPMGGGPLNEDVLEAAKRELKEETGITAQSWSKLMRIHTSNCVTDEEGFIYVAEDLEMGDTAFDETEDLAIRKLPFQEVLEMVMDGKITDSISIAGILKLARQLELRAT